MDHFQQLLQDSHPGSTFELERLLNVFRADLGRLVRHFRGTANRDTAREVSITFESLKDHLGGEFDD